MFLKAHRRKKDGKDHVYYSLTESVRVSRRRVFQRTILHLGELNTTQLDRRQRTVEVVAEVILSSLTLKHPRSFGACWAGCKLWEDLQVDEFWSSRPRRFTSTSSICVADLAPKIDRRPGTRPRGDRNLRKSG